MAQAASVLVPLYVYPVAGAWDPLYQAAYTHPDLTFTVVVNPHSGPGLAPLPDANYTREIPKLNGVDNIRTLGYVATNYGQKSLEDTLSEIATYAAWGAQNASLTLDGIFFDETLGKYDATFEGYLQQLSSSVQDAAGLEEGFIVHNPGVIADKRYMDLADITVVFEQTYDTWNNVSAALALAELNYNPDHMCVLMHSVPDLPLDGLGALVRQVRNSTSNVFITNFDSDYYCGFSSAFTNSLGLLETTSKAISVARS